MQDVSSEIGHKKSEWVEVTDLPKGVFDTHAHYQDPRFDEDRNRIFDQLQEAQASAVVIGSSLKESELALEVAAQKPWLWASVGVHPQLEDPLPEDWIQRLEEMARNKKVVAIGEFGLDYHYEGYDRNLQMSVMKEQLFLAERISKPIIIHSRDAAADTLEILSLAEKPVSGVMHCFSGSRETAQILLKMGFYISFTGVVTFKNAKKAREAADSVPLDRLLLETDCPYMAPEPFRGTRCDSRMLGGVAEVLAQNRGISPQELIDACRDNARRLFNI